MPLGTAKDNQIALIGDGRVDQLVTVNSPTTRVKPSPAPAEGRRGGAPTCLTLRDATFGLPTFVRYYGTRNVAVRSTASSHSVLFAADFGIKCGLGRGMSNPGERTSMKSHHALIAAGVVRGISRSRFLVEQARLIAFPTRPFKKSGVETADASPCLAALEGVPTWPAVFFFGGLSRPLSAAVVWPASLVRLSSCALCRGSPRRKMQRGEGRNL